MIEIGQDRHSDIMGVITDESSHIVDMINIDHEWK